jgi:glycine betaine/proline transport system ATP-binding protein
MEQWLTGNKIPVGRWGNLFFDFLTDYFAWFFDSIANGVSNTLGFIIDAMLAPPAIVVVAIAAALTYLLKRSLSLSSGVAAGLLFIINQGLWKDTVETVALVGGATTVSMAIGVPIGIAAAHRPWLYRLLQPILDLMQTLPTFVYLIPALILFGLGLAPGMIATIIFAIPAPIRLTQLGVSSVPKPLIEAGEAFGATRRQLLWKVELPRPAEHHGRPHPVHHAVAVDGGHRRAGGRQRARPAGGARPQHRQCAARTGSGTCHRGAGDHSRPGVPGGDAHPRRGTQMSGPAVSFRHVDVVFGKKVSEALARLDAGASRSEIHDEIGAVIGVADATFDVGEGEICVLMGLSGSGKSTLVRTVNGLNRPSRGQVLVRDGERAVDVATCNQATLRHMRMHRIAMVFQQFGLLPWRTVAENVGFGLELAGVGERERRDRVQRQLELVCLEEWSGKLAHELSGGMQQRVGLARAFATEAPILLMDEPFSALDPLIRNRLQDELLDLQRQIRRTIIFVSHDLDEALKLGTRIAIMDGGRVVQYAEPHDIVLKPANEYVADFVAHMNPLNVLTGATLMKPLASSSVAATP